jgi:hypothetical protein
MSEFAKAEVKKPVEIAPYRGLFPSPPLFDRMPTYRTQGKRSLNFLSAKTQLELPICNLLTPNGLHPFSQIDPSMAGVGALSNFFLGDSNLSLGGAQSALGGGSANGGFVLYPSTPNLNGVTSACGK